jgi:Flp pilus assembly protein TadG
MWARRARNDRGATAVEFAFVSIPFLVLVIGMIQYGWYFYVSQTTGGAASNVTRRLSVGDCWTGTQAYDLAKQQAPMVTSVASNPSSIPSSAGTEISVTVTANASIIGLVPLPGGGVITKTVYAQMQNTDSSGTCAS